MQRARGRPTLLLPARERHCPDGVAIEKPDEAGRSSEIREEGEVRRRRGSLLIPTTAMYTASGPS